MIKYSINRDLMFVRDPCNRFTIIIIIIILHELGLARPVSASSISLSSVLPRRRPFGL